MDSWNSLLAAIVLLTVFVLFPTAFNVLEKAASIFIIMYLYEFIKNIQRNFIFNEPVSPRNKAVLITGCDSGFGHLLARKLDELGYRVFAGCLFPSGKGAKDLQENSSSKLQILDLDVTSDQSVLSSLNAVEASFADGEELWAVVNNAGVPQAGELDWASLDQLQRVLDVNTMGVVRVTKVFIPLLRKSKGRIVNVNSICGRFCMPGLTGYCMSKAAAVFFTTGLRLELRKWEIKAISVEPFFYQTPMTTHDSTLQIIQKTWDALPNQVKNIYGDNYLIATKKSCTILLNRGSHKLDEVIECLVNAITTKEPLSTYFPCRQPYKFLLLMSRIVPASICESILYILLPKLRKPVALKT